MLPAIQFTLLVLLVAHAVHTVCEKATIHRSTIEKTLSIGYNTEVDRELNERRERRVYRQRTRQEMPSLSNSTELSPPMPPPTLRPYCSFFSHLVLLPFHPKISSVTRFTIAAIFPFHLRNTPEYPPLWLLHPPTFQSPPSARTVPGHCTSSDSCSATS